MKAREESTSIRRGEARFARLHTLSFAWLICGLTVGFTVGCGRHVPRQSVLGRSTVEIEVRWQSVVDALRVAGYHPSSEDPTAGRIVVLSHVHPRVSYAVQFYREGWVQLQIEGMALRWWNGVESPEAQVSGDVAAEYEELALSLVEVVSSGGDSNADDPGAEDPGAEDPDTEDPTAEDPADGESAEDGPVGEGTDS